MDAVESEKARGAMVTFNNFFERLLLGCGDDVELFGRKYLDRDGLHVKESLGQKFDTAGVSTPSRG